MGNELSSEETGPKGKIYINIRAANGSNDCIIELGGEITQLVKQPDITAFGITMEKLKNAIKEINGSFPSYIYVKGDTALVASLYSKNNLNYLKKSWKPLRYIIKAKHAETIAVGSRTLENRSQNTGTYSSNMSHTETNTISTKWSKEGTLTGGLKVDHKIVVPGSAEISFTSNYGEEKEESSSVTIGSETGVSVDLLPGQRAVAKIRIIKNVYEIEIEYEASLTGLIVATYTYFVKIVAKRYDIDELMKLMGLKNSIVMKEVIRINYFTDGEVVLEDIGETKPQPQPSMMSYIFGK